MILALGPDILEPSWEFTVKVSSAGRRASSPSVALTIPKWMKAARSTAVRTCRSLDVNSSIRITGAAQIGSCTPLEAPLARRSHVWIHALTQLIQLKVNMAETIDESPFSG